MKPAILLIVATGWCLLAQAPPKAAVKTPQKPTVASKPADEQMTLSEFVRNAKKYPLMKTWVTISGSTWEASNASDKDNPVFCPPENLGLDGNLYLAILEDWTLKNSDGQAAASMKWGVDAFISLVLPLAMRDALQSTFPCQAKARKAAGATIEQQRQCMEDGWKAFDRIKAQPNKEMMNNPEFHFSVPRNTCLMKYSELPFTKGVTPPQPSVVRGAVMEVYSGKELLSDLYNLFMVYEELKPANGNAPQYTPEQRQQAKDRHDAFDQQAKILMEE